MMGKVRSFFHKKGVMEVDTPLLFSYPSIDPHIDLFKTTQGDFLHSSPEYGMKYLLSQGSGDIYQLSHVYRLGEESPLHHQEYTLIEWYRTHISQEDFLDETLALLHLFLGKHSHQILTYREAFLRYGSLDPFEISKTQLLEQAKVGNLHLSPAESLSSLLNMVWGCWVEPKLGESGITFICDYPADQAIFAQTKIKNHTEVAERFEAYYRGIEVSNGYHEVRTVEQQYERFQNNHVQRVALGKKDLPLPTLPPSSLFHPLPDCYGNALGFDRLVMLGCGCTNIRDILPISTF